MKTKTVNKEKNEAAHTLLLHTQLRALHMTYVEQHFETSAAQAAQEQLTHIDYLAQWIENECKRKVEMSAPC
jgi:hypothetical protein